MVPAVPPGTHAVRLGGRRARDDGGRDYPQGGLPESVDRKGVTDEDLVVPYDFRVRAWDEVDRARRAVVDLRRVMGELEERLEGVGDEGVIEAAERLTVALEEIEGQIHQVQNRSD